MSKEKRDGKTFPQTVDGYLEVVRMNLQVSAEHVDDWSDCYSQTSRIKALANKIQSMSDEIYKIRLHGLPLESERTVPQFVNAIEKLPDFEYKNGLVRWFGTYNKRGANNRIPGMNRAASYAYNHLLAPEWMLSMNLAAGVSPVLVNAARRAAKAVTKAKSPAGLRTAKAAAMRKCLSWTVLANALWPKTS
jgi:hypothetical protein